MVRFMVMHIPEAGTFTAYKCRRFLRFLGWAEWKFVGSADSVADAEKLLCCRWLFALHEIQYRTLFKGNIREGISL